MNENNIYNIAKAAGAEEAWKFAMNLMYNENTDEYYWYTYCIDSLSDLGNYRQTKAKFDAWKAKRQDPKVSDGVEFKFNSEDGYLIDDSEEKRKIYTELFDWIPSTDATSAIPI